MNLYLIGYRCAGKTSVGRRLSGEISWPFIDLDEKIVQTAGMTINEMVAQKGWEGFRRLEKETLKEVSHKDSQVIATGGGIVLDDENVQGMKATGKIIWLKVKPQSIAARMATDHQTPSFRPALTGKSCYEEIEATLYTREPRYQEAMDFEVDTDELDVRDVCQTIITIVKIMFR